MICKLVILGQTASSGDSSGLSKGDAAEVSEAFGWKLKKRETAERGLSDPSDLSDLSDLSDKRGAKVVGAEPSAKDTLF